MSSISITQFFAEATGVTSRLIPQGYAQKSLNADTSNFTLKSFNGLGDSPEDSNRGTAETIYRYPNGKWLAWTEDVDVVRSPLVEDAWSRIYWTGQGEPKMAAVDEATSGVAPYPNAWYTLGVPAADGVPLITPPTGEVPTTAVDAVYAIAYVTEYEEVGPLSLPSDEIVRWDETGDVVVDIPSIVAPGRNITKVRIFRSEAGGQYNFVADVVAGVASFTDSVKSEDLLSPAESIDWYPPPADMRGLIAGPGSALYGFSGNQLCASEPGDPHAWPIEYRLTTQDEIVGIQEVASGIAVMTKGEPALAIGSTPNAISLVKSDEAEPCVSKRSIVNMGEYVIYASPNGLVGIGGSGVNRVTKNLVTREAWKELNPSSIHAYRDGDNYLAFYDGGSFKFTLDRGFEFLDITAESARYIEEHDALYIHDGNELLKKWEEGSALSYSWKSGAYEVQPGTSFTCGKVIADSYPLTLKLYADGSEVCSIQIISRALFRLPEFDASFREIEIEVLGSSEVYNIQIAQSPSEVV